MPLPGLSLTQAGLSFFQGPLCPGIPPKGIEPGPLPFCPIFKGGLLETGRQGLYWEKDGPSAGNSDGWLGQSAFLRAGAAGPLPEEGRASGGKFPWGAGAFSGAGCSAFAGRKILRQEAPARYLWKREAACPHRPMKKDGSGKSLPSFWLPAGSAGVTFS